MATLSESKTSEGFQAGITPSNDFSSFFSSISGALDMSVSEPITSIEQFKSVITSLTEHIKTKGSGITGISKGKMTNQNIGGVIMANLCKKRLIAYRDNHKRPSDEAETDLINRRINQLFSKQFVLSFASSLPMRSHGAPGATTAVTSTAAMASGENDDDDNSGQGSYTLFYNELFNLTSGKFKWRGKILAPVSNDLQCLRAMGNSSPSTSVHDMHNKGDLKCYICDCAIKTGMDKMQCEHILPIVTALAHWWLVKPIGTTPRNLNDIYNPDTVGALSYEYAWSHACCNLIKNNWEIVKIDGTGCSPDNRGITDMLQAIWEGAGGLNERGNTLKRLFDCHEVNRLSSEKKGVGCLTSLGKIVGNNRFGLTARGEQARTNIQTILKPLCDNISTNITRCTDYQIYELLTKFKVISAIDDDNFLSILLNLSTDELPSEVLSSQAAKEAADLWKSIYVSFREVNNLASQINNLNKKLEKMNKRIDDEIKNEIEALERGTPRTQDKRNEQIGELETERETLQAESETLDKDTLQVTLFINYLSATQQMYSKYSDYLKVNGSASKLLEMKSSNNVIQVNGVDIHRYEILPPFDEKFTEVTQERREEMITDLQDDIDQYMITVRDNMRGGRDPSFMRTGVTPGMIGVTPGMIGVSNRELTIGKLEKYIPSNGDTVKLTSLRKALSDPSITSKLDKMDSSAATDDMVKTNGDIGKLVPKPLSFNKSTDVELKSKINEKIDELNKDDADSKKTVPLFIYSAIDNKNLKDLPAPNFGPTVEDIITEYYNSFIKLSDDDNELDDTGSTLGGSKITKKRKRKTKKRTKKITKKRKRKRKNSRKRKNTRKRRNTRKRKNSRKRNN